MDLPKGFELKTVITFDQRDLENLILEVWGKKYDTGLALDFPHNGSYYDYEITGDYDGEYSIDDPDDPYAWDGYFDRDRVVERLDASEMLLPGPQDVLTALAELSKIPYGDYILHYWW